MYWFTKERDTITDTQKEGIKKNTGIEETKKQIYKSIEFIWDTKTKQNNTLKQNVCLLLTIRSSLNPIFLVGS